MNRAILIIFVCLIFATLIVTWFQNLPNLSPEGRKAAKNVIIVVLVAAAIFAVFLGIMMWGNHNPGVIKQ